MRPGTRRTAGITAAQGYGGTALLVAHVLLAPYGLSEPTSALAAFMQATLFLLLLLILLNAANDRTLLVGSVAALAAATVARLLAPTDANVVHAVTDLGFAGCGLVALWVAMLHVLRTREVSPALISGAIGLYLLAGVVWALIFHAIELFERGSFTRSSSDLVSASDLYYFSFVTITTLGYGDISPASALARSSAVLEAVFGQVFLVALLGRLISLGIARPSGRLHEHAGKTGRTPG